MEYKENIKDPATQELDYPVFVLRNGMSLYTDRTQTSKEDAKAYYDAFLAAVPFRICTLLQWLGEHLSYNACEDLLRVGKKVTKTVSKREYYSRIEPAITLNESKLHCGDTMIFEPRAASMCIDMGILLAVYLLQLNHEKIKWGMRMQGPKMVDYHQVRVFSHLNHLRFDPIFSSTAWGNSFRSNGHTYRIWSECYLMWCDALEGRKMRSLRNV